MSHVSPRAAGLPKCRDAGHMPDISWEWGPCGVPHIAAGNYDFLGLATNRLCLWSSRSNSDFYSSCKVSRGTTAAQHGCQGSELGCLDPHMSPASHAGRAQHPIAVLHCAAMDHGDAQGAEPQGRTDANPLATARLEGCCLPQWLNHMFGDKS